ncbi:LANO_0G03972g1_1 [Lachancea nothofagi CBS 11611]|uniref:LANO_0G03972g1_1 n=1 Tax=Lachancea nothofagi CBS 11611 TaxID=1266666 RepID=A0A1G4KGB7_9SACH|nr:LANO_0G03972g1_1 [Lachancea nothofagi CBS 11611]
MRFTLLWAFLLSFAVANIALEKPTQGQTFSPSGGKLSIDVQWHDDGKQPTIDKFEYYTVLLCYGSNSEVKCIKQTNPFTVQAADVTKDGDEYSVTATFDSTIAGNGQYYLQLYGFISDDGGNLMQSIQYSPRFLLSSMAGTITPTVSTTSQPANQVQYNTETNKATGDISKSFTIPYTEQTGPTRYAPMQMQPSGSVTATTWTRRFATSSVTYYSTFYPSQEQVSTITPGWSYTITSAVNWATPQPYPSQNGAWYDPKSRQSLTTRKLNQSNFKSSSA